MLCVTGETFALDFLDDGALFFELFNLQFRLEGGTAHDMRAVLRDEPEIVPRALEGCVAAAAGMRLAPDEAVALASFVRRCLRLHPQDRPTAEELLEDSFF